MLLVGLNDEKTDVFTIGCLSSPVVEADRYRRTGYVEFALNDRVAISDAQSYFPAFFPSKDRCVHQTQLTTETRRILVLLRPSPRCRF